MKDSDPELFSEAWNKLPDQTRANILSYLKKYPNLLEKEYPLLLLHRSGKLSGDEVEEFEEHASPSDEFPSEAVEPIESGGAVQRRQAARTVPPRKARNKTMALQSGLRTAGRSSFRSSLNACNRRRTTRSSARREADSEFLAELRKISKQNSIQIELLQKLLQTNEEQE